MLQVIPGILEKEFTEIKRKVVKVAPYVEWVQIDLADGLLVENKTFSDAGAFFDLPIPPKRELHMMVENPTEQVDEWVEAGFERIIAQVEGIGDPEGFIDAVQLHSVEIGLALDISTPVSLVAPYLDMLDVLLLMGVEAGFSGQEFDRSVLSKIGKARNISDMLRIEVDGGIDKKTARLCSDAGADIVVSTSYIFGSDDIGTAIDELAKAG